MNLNNCNYSKYASIYVLDDTSRSSKPNRLMNKVYTVKCRFLLVLDWVKLSKYICFSCMSIKLNYLIIKRLQINVNMKTAFAIKRTI